MKVSKKIVNKNEFGKLLNVLNFHWFNIKENSSTNQMKCNQHQLADSM